MFFLTRVLEGLQLFMLFLSFFFFGGGGGGGGGGVLKQNGILRSATSSPCPRPTTSASAWRFPGCAPRAQGWQKAESWLGNILHVLGYLNSIRNVDSQVLNRGAFYRGVLGGDEGVLGGFCGGLKGFFGD